MKRTIGQIEQQFEKKLGIYLKSLLQELRFPILNSRVRVSLRDSKGTKKRSNASAENWSPESGCLQIWFETAPDGPSPGQRIDANLDFVPVEIRGDTLSATILRERR